MKKLLLSIAVAAAAPFAWAQVSETTTSTTTTTEGGGTITEFTPGSAIVLKETTGPRRYRFGKTVTYVTKSGKTLDEDTVRTRIKGFLQSIHFHEPAFGAGAMFRRAGNEILARNFPTQAVKHAGFGHDDDISRR